MQTTSKEIATTREVIDLLIEALEPIAPADIRASFRLSLTGLVQLAQLELVREMGRDFNRSMNVTGARV